MAQNSKRRKSEPRPPPPPLARFPVWVGNVRDLAQALVDRAQAAGIGAFLTRSQNEHGASFGRAWVSLEPDGLHARREGAAAPFPKESEVRAWTEREADLGWAVEVLATGRTCEVGKGVGLRHMQDAVYAHFQTVDYPMEHLVEIVKRPDDPWDLNPDYQRDHVWTEEQRRKFVGYFLVVQRMPLVFLNYGRRGLIERAEVIDGKQRLTSIEMFLEGRISAQLPDDPENVRPLWWRDFDEVDRRCAPMVKCARVYLPTREDVLQFYLNLNGGGTVHAPEELAKVRALLDVERAKKNPPERSTNDTDRDAAVALCRDYFALGRCDATLEGYLALKLGSAAKARKIVDLARGDRSWPDFVESFAKRGA